MRDEFRRVFRLWTLTRYRLDESLGDFRYGAI